MGKAGKNMNYAVCKNKKARIDTIILDKTDFRKIRITKDEKGEGNGPA